VAGIGVWDTGRGDSAGDDVPLPKAADKSVVYEYWSIDVVCILGYELAFFYPQTYLAISRFMEGSVVVPEDVDLIRVVLDGSCGDHTINS
jgi:hypothetical protein